MYEHKYTRSDRLNIVMTCVTLFTFICINVYIASFVDLFCGILGLVSLFFGYAGCAHLSKVDVHIMKEETIYNLNKEKSEDIL